MLIPLTQGKTAHISRQDWLLLRPYHWIAIRHRTNWYAVTKDTGRVVYMHRLIMGEPSLKVDHKDRDGLNNRRGNLRLATDSQNQGNRRNAVNNRSGYKGVCWDRGWLAYIRIHGERVYLGRHKTAAEAGAAYQRAAKKHFGAFAT